MKKLFCSLVAVLCLNQLFASHFEGGEIRYEYSGTANTYYIYLDIYAQCGTSYSGTTANIGVTGPSAYTNTLTAALFKTDSIQPYCPGTTTKCMSSTASYPGYRVFHYSAAITLPSSPGVYMFTYSTSARTTVNNIGSGNFWIQAMLDNNTAINSSPIVPNPYAMFTTSSTATSCPMHATDLEGDSIVYEFVSPLDNGSPIVFNAGYSLSTLLGSTGICSLSNGNLITRAATMGNYTIAMRIKDYRKGILVGYTNRDFIVSALASSSIHTVPTPASASTLQSTTCPGATNSVTMTFNDPVTTDSVFVTITPPVISGWSFTVTSAPGVGSGTATISWTTPSTMNPATLPYILMPVFVRDNGCTLRAMANYMHIVRTSQCVSDSVWPGDANGDKTVNIYDPLAIAIAYGNTGASRTGASTSWVAQGCTPWGTSFASGVNTKHADCDGNGTVNSSDLGAVSSNWGMTHPKMGEGSQNKITGLPDLKFDHTGIKFTPGATITIPLKFGDPTSMVNNIYGICSRIYVDGIVLASLPTFTYTTSWLGTSSNTLNFTQKISNNNTLDWAYARTTHSNISGQGIFAYITFTIPATTTVGTKVILRFGNQKVIDKDGNDVANFNVINDTAVVEATSTNGLNQLSPLSYAAVIPNPSVGNAELYLSLKEDASLHVNVTDMAGKIIWQSKQQFKNGNHYISLPSQNISTGVYLIQVQDNQHHAVYNLKWMKQ